MKDYNADYKAMYYLLAGRMASAVETLEATVKLLGSAVTSFEEITDGLKNAQQAAEDMFINYEENKE